MALFASAPERKATSLNRLPNLPEPEKEFSKALIPGKTIIGTMRGRMLVCIVLGLLAVTPALAPASEQESEKVLGIPSGWTDDIRLTVNSTPDRNPSIASYLDHVHIVWVNMWSGQSEIYYMNSTDAGQIWNNRKRLSLGDPVDADYPDIGINQNKRNRH